MGNRIADIGKMKSIVESENRLRNVEAVKSTKTAVDSDRAV
jgi:hypothetical protein